MRKHVKEQAKTFLGLLFEAERAIETALRGGNYPLAAELLEQSQQGAISLGQLIEDYEGEGFVTVRFLEEYCEILFQVFSELESERFSNAVKLCKKLRKCLIRVDSSVKYDIKERLEIVFLPYKASMWDCMESVYRAAAQDTDCDAYVIPIPYYDRNPDGSFGKLHYEGGMYPADIPVVNYKSYNFEKRRPDMIFFHNPYDECNYVTSVHPDFYAKNLKKYTERLVYIPYFIFPEFDIENKQSVKENQHFCITPGVIHADYAIMQSENIRQFYINTLTRSAGEETRQYWEKKILGLGSPKLDLPTTDGNSNIPDAWLRLIQKSDGSRKTVVLYNTTIAPLLAHSEQMLEKIRNVLQVFEARQNDVTLLWRPHPLLLTTIESMRPWLRQQYLELIQGYRAAGWGIYDDSPDLNRALCLCDAYYGDSSSLCQLITSMKKPLMIQNANLQNK